MSKYLLRFLLWAIFCLPAIAFAAAPSATTVDANYEWGVEVAASSQLNTGSVTLPDTLTGTGDSAILLKHYAFPSRFEFSLVRGPNGGTLTTNDTVITRADFFNVNKTYLYSVYIDTIIAAATAGHNILLPVNRVGWAPYVSIVMKPTAALSTRVFTTPATVQVNKRRAVISYKLWQ